MARRILTALDPKLPPEGKNAFCFYPMSKRRVAGDNWYSLPFDERKELMLGHGATGRTFAGRVLQVVTGSTGIDDYEWGVSLFAVKPDDLKDVVYTMRFDEASARTAEFGPFYTGLSPTSRGSPQSRDRFLSARVGHRSFARIEGHVPCRAWHRDEVPGPRRRFSRGGPAFCLARAVGASLPALSLNVK